MNELPDIFSVYRPYAGRCGVFCATGNAFSIASDLSSCYSPRLSQQLRVCLLVVASEPSLVQVFLWRLEICDRHFVCLLSWMIRNSNLYFLIETTLSSSQPPRARDISGPRGSYGKCSDSAFRDGTLPSLATWGVGWRVGGG